MTEFATDPLDRQLRRLTPSAPNDLHSASVRARCHAALARRHRHSDAGAGAAWSIASTLETVLVGGVAVAYFALVVYDALQVYGAV